MRRNTGKACVMTNTNDPTIVGTYSDILTISSCTDSTTLTQSSSNSDMTLWTRKDLTDFIAAELRKTTLEIINPVIKKLKIPISWWKILEIQ